MRLERENVYDLIMKVKFKLKSKDPKLNYKSYGNIVAYYDVTNPNII